jgi:hypothetical protein
MNKEKIASITRKGAIKAFLLLLLLIVIILWDKEVLSIPFIDPIRIGFNYITIAIFGIIIKSISELFLVITVIYCFKAILNLLKGIVGSAINFAYDVILISMICIPFGIFSFGLNGIDLTMILFGTTNSWGLTIDIDIKFFIILLLIYKTIIFGIDILQYFDLSDFQKLLEESKEEKEEIGEIKFVHDEVTHQKTYYPTEVIKGKELAYINNELVSVEIITKKKGFNKYHKIRNETESTTEYIFE